MKLDLAPQLSAVIGTTTIYWFGFPNQYLLAEERLALLIRLFLDANSEVDFLNNCQEDAQVSIAEANKLYSEIDQLLQDVHFKDETVLTPSQHQTVPDEGTRLFYKFNNTIISVFYGSQRVQKLIHPQRAHAETTANDNPLVRFQLFEQDQLLYFYKNGSYICHYPFSDYHYIQGRFSLELINALYCKTEDDWVATFHASTISNGKECMMIIGDSGNGKSTLSAILMAKGYDLVADDFTPLSADNLEIYRVPSAISVKEGAFKILGPLFSDFDTLKVEKSPSKNLRIKYIPPSSEFHNTKNHFPCTKIVYVSYNAKSTSHLKAVGMEQVLPTLIPESWLSPLASNASKFLEWLKVVDCYELQYSDNDFAIAGIDNIFNS